MHKFSLAAAAAAAALALSACSTVDLDKDKDAAGVGADGNMTLEQQLNNPNGPLANKSVYFGFDSYSVEPEQTTVVTNHAKFLSANKNVKVTLEGNTDERGGREYNLALGQKRSDAVKQRMTLLGVNPDQIETVSFGKEKPKDEGHDEAAWAENRRVDLRYTLPAAQ